MREEDNQGDTLKKLQGKISEIDNYLMDKDKTILE